jgi:hypothetical protein
MLEAWNNRDVDAYCVNPGAILAHGNGQLF